MSSLCGGKAARLLVGLLIVSLLLDFALIALYIKEKQRDEKIINELCGSITLSSISASSRLDEALENNNRRFALMAAIEIEQLSGLLESGVSKELGVQNTYGPGSLSSLSELIIWGDSTLGIDPIGSTDDAQFHSNEIDIITRISVALKEFALYFYDPSVDENTYMYESRAHSSIKAINDALSTLQFTARDIFEMA